MMTSLGIVVMLRKQSTLSAALSSALVLFLVSDSKPVDFSPIIGAGGHFLYASRGALGVGRLVPSTVSFVGWWVVDVRSALLSVSTRLLSGVFC